MVSFGVWRSLALPRSSAASCGRDPPPSPLNCVGHMLALQPEYPDFGDIGAAKGRAS